MKCRADLATMRTSMVRALSLSAALALVLNPALTPVVAADYRPVAPVAADGQMNARFLSLGVGKSIVIDLPRDIKDVLVADPKIANAVVRSSQRAYIIGATVGQTNIVFFDSAGQQIAAYDIAVKRDLNGVRAALKQILPNSDIQIDGLGEGVVLTGTAANPMEAQQANDLAVLVDKQHVERDQGVLHPHRDDAGPLLREQHALIRRQVADEHQSQFLVFRRVGDADVEPVDAA